MDIPKNVFDKEYSTQWRREVKFLEDRGVPYIYAKRHYKYPVVKYKYEKTPELFLALAEFYKQVYIENIHRKIDNAAKELLPLENGCIDINVSDMTDAEKKLMNVTEQDIEDVLNG